MCGCLVYGQGQTVGYITTVEDGIFWNTVWIRADNASSQTNGYALSKESSLRDSLEKISSDKIRVKLFFKKHILMARFGEDTTDDEIVNFEIMK